MELTVPVVGGVVWAEHRSAEGVAVVMLHPGWGDSSIGDGVVSRLPERARTIRYDAPGYGRSPAPTGTFAALTDLIEVLDRLDIKEAIMVGHSAGAPLRWALRWLSPIASVH
jgi:3-oxoadipate enol-lactonase